MSRVDDLADLVRTTNDMLLANESQNIRSVYIQVDDICELALKSYLQANVVNWQPVDPGRSTKRHKWYKGFRKVVAETKAEFAENQQVCDLLDRFVGRRDERNHFFHDQNLSGLTVTKEKCFEALCDLYDLLEILFAEFSDIVEGNLILKTQIAVMRLKERMWEDGYLNSRYHTVLSRWRHSENSKYLPVEGVVLLRHPCLGYEFCVVYVDARGLYDGLDEAGLVV